jgi:5-methylcytosine-specific restriction endonuclease McrA
VNDRPKLKTFEKKLLRDKLYLRDGYNCHYCGIVEENFTKIWGDTFYGGFKRGQRLEIDRVNNAFGYTPENCVLACAVCNMAKSDKFTHDEFLKVGASIRNIWQEKSRNRLD